MFLRVVVPQQLSDVGLSAEACHRYQPPSPGGKLVKEVVDSIREVETEIDLELQRTNASQKIPTIFHTLVFLIITLKHMGADTVFDSKEYVFCSSP